MVVSRGVLLERDAADDVCGSDTGVNTERDVGVADFLLVVGEIADRLSGLEKLFSFAQASGGGHVIAWLCSGAHDPDPLLIRRRSVRRDPCSSMPSCSASSSTGSPLTAGSSSSPDSRIRASLPVQAVADCSNSKSWACQRSESGSHLLARTIKRSMSLSAVASPRATEPNSSATFAGCSHPANVVRRRSISCSRRLASPSIHGAARWLRL